MAEPGRPFSFLSLFKCPVKVNMFGTSGTHESRLLERTMTRLYKGETLGSILNGLTWSDRMIVLRKEKDLMKYLKRFKELCAE